jgi:hypothetical protein
MKKIVLFIVAVLVVCWGANAQLTTKVPKTLGKVAHQRSTPQVEMKKIDEAVKVLPVSKTKLNNIPVKEVLSTKKLKNGMEFRIVRLENGMVKKQLINPAKQLQRKISPNKNPDQNFNSTAITAAPESLFEGFEGWDEEDWDWLPDGWTDESKVGSGSDLEDVYGDKYNFTWRTSYFNPKRGQYSAGVQFAYPLKVLSGEDTIKYNPIPQDEWLISPAVTVKQADYVFAFDLYYNPLWARIDILVENDTTIYKINLDTIHTVVEALVSIDGGNTWTKKWDNREDVAQYTEDELLAFGISAPWLRVSIDLKEYLNQDIKVAFRYWNDGGESVYVDNVTVGYPSPEASYRRPRGYLISGLSENYRALDANVIAGNAYTPTQWYGSVENAETINWNFSDYISSTEQNPVVTLPYSLFYTPVLTATSKGGTKEFQLGVEGEDNYMFLGGDNRWNIGETQLKLFGLGNYDLQYKFTKYTNINAEGMASYGTFKGVANYFEKPANKYMFQTFYVHAGNVVAKPDEPIKLDLYAVNENNMVGDLIASSETYPEDFIFSHETGGYKYYTIPFKFKAIDPETGREVESYVEIDNHFVAEFYNYASADIFFQSEDHPTGDGYAYIVLEEEYLSLGATSALFDTDASLTFLYPLNDEPHTGRYAAPVEGGTKEFQLISYWLASGWWLKEELPDWISIGEPVYYQSGDYNYILPVTAAPLPQGVNGRKADVTIQAPGCEMTLEIKQGEAWWTGINPVTSKNVKVVNQGDRFVLTYPAGTASVTVYNVAGQKIAEYALNPDGTYSIPAAHWSKGIYVMKFAGKANETVKVIK